MKAKTVYESENGKEFQTPHEAVLEDLRHILINTAGPIMPKTSGVTVPIDHLIASLEWAFDSTGTVLDPFFALLLEKKFPNTPINPPKSI